jgi:hypothetical protein
MHSVGFAGSRGTTALVDSTNGTPFAKDNCTPGKSLLILSVPYQNAGYVGDGIV